MNIEENYEKFKSLLLSTKRPGIERLIEWLDNTDLKVAPASGRYHDSLEGGLVYHNLMVYQELCKMTEYIERYEIPQDTLIITALLHDLCKVGVYQVDSKNVKDKETGQWYSVPYYSFEDDFPVGHAEKSIIVAQQFIRLTKVEIAMIRNHMGFSRDETPEVSKLYELYPQAVLLSNADMLATYIWDSRYIVNE